MMPSAARAGEQERVVGRSQVERIGERAAHMVLTDESSAAWLQGTEITHGRLDIRGRETKGAARARTRRGVAAAAAPFQGLAGLLTVARDPTRAMQARDYT